MLTIAYYFLQVVLCSGMLMGYYWLVLRNKRFHQYNRFFLLAAALLSWIVPLMKITWNRPLLQSGTPPVMNILSVVADNNTQIEASLAQKNFIWNWDLFASAVYIAVATVLLLSTVHAFVKLYRLMKHHSCKNVGDVFLILTHAKGTPFSFFRYIFWNEEIDIRSEAGQQILKHELTHVQQKHSFDKLFIQLMLIGGWFNPFFWLLKKEMEMIHEFIADKKAVNSGDTAALAKMLLTAAYPQQKFALTHPFFFSPIKRRLLMLTNNKNPRFSYIRRMVVLPLLAIVVVLFAFRSKEQRNAGELSIASVVENYKEEITDAFAKEDMPADFLLINGKKFSAETIDMRDLAYGPYLMGLTEEKQINTHKSSISYEPIENSDVPEPLYIVNGQRIGKAELSKLSPNSIKEINVFKNADAIQLYGADAANGVIVITLKSTYTSGAEAAVGKEESGFSFPNLTGVAKDNYNNIPKNRKVYVTEIIYQGEEKQRVYEEVHETRTDNNGAFSVKIGAGTRDASSKEFSQVELSRGPFHVNVKVAVVPSIPAPWWIPEQNYVDLGFSQVMVKDNRPDQTGSAPAFSGFLRTMPNGDVKWNGQDGNSIILRGQSPSTSVTETKKEESAGAENEEVIVQGFKKTKPTITTVEPAEVTVIGFGTKKQNAQPAQPARFPGGELAWEKYLSRNLNKDFLKNNKAAPGKYTVIVSFLVDKDGAISEVHADNDPGYGTKAEAERVIAKGPKWEPGTNENGKPVLFRQKQAIFFNYGNEKVAVSNDRGTIKATSTPLSVIKATTVPLSDNEKGVITARSMPLNGTEGGGVIKGNIPTFPGGLAAWAKYLDRAISKEELVAKGAAPGKYTVNVSFTVEADGGIKDIKADNDPGFGTKEQAVRVISKGPNWVPANANGKPISWRHNVAITFSVNDARAANTDPVEKGEGTNVPYVVYNANFKTSKGKSLTVSPNTTAVAEINIPNVKKGDPILVTPQRDFPDWAIYSAWVSKENKVSVRFANYTAKEVKIGADDYRITVVR